MNTDELKAISESEEYMIFCDPARAHILDSVKNGRVAAEELYINKWFEKQDKRLYVTALSNLLTEEESPKRIEFFNSLDADGKAAYIELLLKCLWGSIDGIRYSIDDLGLRNDDLTLDVCTAMSEVNSVLELLIIARGEK